MSNFSFMEDSPQDAAFRAEVRNWLEENLPRNLRGWSVRPPPDLLKEFHKRLYAKGWIAPHWPKEYGGTEMSLHQRLL